MIAEKDKKVLMSNFFSLAILQWANFLLPLLAVPYLLRVIGIELYGFLAFATAMIMYLSILSDYGFNLTATREISIYRNSQEKIIEIFSSVMIIKFILMILGLLIITLIIIFFDRFREHWIIYYLTFGIVIGQILFPIWFFQGMEKMKYISILNILAKSIFLIAIFIFVRAKEDFYLVPIFNSLGFIIAGFISLCYIRNKFNVSFQFQSIDTLMIYLKDGWHIFISRIAVVLYTSSNIFILGLFTNNTIVGYYSIVEQIIGGVSSLGSMVNRTLFPYLSKIWSQNRQSYYFKFKIVFKIMASSMFVFAIILYIFSPDIIKLISGKNIEESTTILQILSISVILFPLGGLFTQSFVTQKENIYVTKSTLYTMLINLILVFWLIKFYGVYGLAITVVLVQILHFSINIYYFIYIKKEYI